MNAKNERVCHIQKEIFKFTTVKWIVSDISRGLATGLASEYKKKICLALRFPAVLPEGVFNFCLCSGSPYDPE